MFWDGDSRRVTAVLDVKGKVRSLAFDYSGALLAVGLADGGVRVLDVRALPRAVQVAWCKTLSSAVDELKFSPDGALLAAGSHDTMIDIYSRESGFKRSGDCVRACLLVYRTTC